MLECKFCKFKANIKSVMVDHIFRMHLTDITSIEGCYSGEVEPIPLVKNIYYLPEVPKNLPIRETAFYQFLANHQEELSTTFFEDLCLFAPDLAIGFHKLVEGQFDTYKLIHSEFCYRMLRKLEL